jgi:hypothetical protein
MSFRSYKFFDQSIAKWRSNCELEFKSGVGSKEKISDLEIVALNLSTEFISYKNSKITVETTL